MATKQRKTSQVLHRGKAENFLVNVRGVYLTVSSKSQNVRGESESVR